MKLQELHSLGKATQYNGEIVELLEYFPEKQRWAVKLRSNGKRISTHVRNLKDTYNRVPIQLKDLIRKYF